MTLSDYEVKRLADDINADPQLIPRIADLLMYVDAVRLSYRLTNPNRVALFQRYKEGMSKQPGWLVKLLHYRGRVEVKFIQGAKNEAEARRKAVKPKADKRYIPKVLMCQRVGDWPHPVA